MKQLFEAQKCNFKSLWYDDEMRGKDAHKREEFTVMGQVFMDQTQYAVACV